MPRYFIKLDAPFPVDDQEGEYYIDTGHARRDALNFLADLLKDRCHEIRSGENWKVHVYDATATLVCRLGFTADFTSSNGKGATASLSASPETAPA